QAACRVDALDRRQRIVHRPRPTQFLKRRQNEFLIGGRPVKLLDDLLADEQRPLVAIPPWPREFLPVSRPPTVPAVEPSHFGNLVRIDVAGQYKATSGRDGQIRHGLKASSLSLELN